MADSARSGEASKRKTRRSSPPQSMLWGVPAAVFLLLFFFLPLAGIVWISVTAGPNGALSLTKYVEFFSNTGNLAVLHWTFVLAAIVTALCILTAYPVAYLIRKATPGISGLVLLAVLLPYFTSYLVRTYAWMVLLGRSGPINQLSIALGSSKPLQIIYSSSAVIVGMTYILMPYCVLILVSVMKAIPDQLIQAAASLGANRTRGFLRIFLPLSTPGIAPAALLTFIFALGFYITPVLLGGPGDITVPMLIDTSVNTTLDWSAGATAAVVLLALTLVVYAAANRLMRIEKLLTPRSAQNPTEQRRLLASSASGGMVSAIYIGSLDATSRFFSRWRIFSRDGERISRRLGNIVPGISALVVLFLLSPLFIIVPISFSSSNFLRFPPPGFSLRWYESFLSSPEWLSAIWQSIKIGSLSAIFSVAIGTGAALFVTRTTPRLRALSFQFLLAPLVVPSIVGSVALYFLFAKFQLIGTAAALVLAHSVVAVPIVVLIVAAGLQAVDPRLERAAASLGAPPTTVLWRVTFPLIKPSLLISAFLAFLHSFDEVVYALFLSGPRLVTLPMRMWSGVRDEISPTIAAVSSLLMLVTVLIYGLTELSRRSHVAHSAT